MPRSIDLACASGLMGLLATALLAFTLSSLTWGRVAHPRLAREAGLPLLGKLPLEAVYAAILPIGRALARAGISANAVTVTSLVIASAAGALFATGHFGAGAAVAVVAGLADALDGVVARTTGTAGRLGQVLDTLVDRYVEAILVGCIAVYVRESVLLLALALAALVGSFIVSYASSVLRELGADDAGAPMRRAHRMTYLLGGAALVPFAENASPHGSLGLRLAPLVVALAAIAVVGNVSAVRRLLRAARLHPHAAPAEPAPGVSAEVGAKPAVVHELPS